MCLCNPTYEGLSFKFICEILPTTLTNLFVNACLEKIDPDKSKHVAILFQHILRGNSNIDMLAYQVRNY